MTLTLLGTGTPSPLTHRAGSSYLSMHSIDLEFGLGQVDRVETIEVLWPSGRQQILTDLEVDQVLLIEEPEG